MVANAETISEPDLHGQRRRTSISSAPSGVKKSSSMNSGSGIWSTLIHREVAEVNGGPTILTDQKFECKLGNNWSFNLQLSGSDSFPSGHPGGGIS